MIHLVDERDRPRTRLYCRRPWIKVKDGVVDIVTVNHYTFTPEHVTCPKCKESYESQGGDNG